MDRDSRCRTDSGDLRDLRCRAEFGTDGSVSSSRDKLDHMDHSSTETAIYRCERQAFTTVMPMVSVTI